MAVSASVPVDMAILNAYIEGNAGPAFLNERLMNDLRPTLFLTQLSNLLAGNIAIVHGVSGTSRTFMGEEAASIDAARIALAQINPVKAISRWLAPLTMASGRIS